MLTHKIYYQLKPFIPRSLQIALRRSVVLRKCKSYTHVWPIDEKAGKAPDGWSGWPDGKRFALVLTHDVETPEGQERCMQLAKLEESFDFRSSFNFVAEEYNVSAILRNYLTRYGFEIGVHGLYHNNNPFRSKKVFQKQVVKINKYLKDWGSVGFRTHCMYHNLDWVHDLNIEYDSSTFDTDPFEPQPDGVSTIFPFWVQNGSTPKGYVELPYTIPQDFSLFILMKEKNIDIWKKKLDWIAENGGMALIITHPDYVNFEQEKPPVNKYPVEYYEKFLIYIKRKYAGQYWHALPKDVALFWAKRFSNRAKDVEKVRSRNRICMVSYSFYENDNRVIRYAETLVKRNDHVDVIALRKKGQPFYETVRGVNVYRIQSRMANEKGRISHLARLLIFLINSSIFLTLKHLRNHYKLIHVHSIPDFEVFAGLIPKILGAKLILDIHDIVPELYASKFGDGSNHLVAKALAKIEKISIKLSNHVIISNSIWEQKLLSRSVGKKKCSVILNYPDPAFFFRRARIRGDNKFIMIYPGTLNWHQGLDIAIRAFSKIKEKVPEAEFHIYGRGGEMENLRNLIEQVDIKSHVFLKAPLPIDQIAEIMANADLGVIPKRNDSFGGEAFSTKILEFMSMGVPVIVSATKIDKHYFNDSVVKFFMAEDEEDLAECMLKMIKDEYLRKSLAENASKFVEDLSWEKRKCEYLSLVDRLTGGS